MDKLHILKEKMVHFYHGDPGRIHHFLKVHSFSKWIGEEEGLDARTQEILEATAFVHDIGIRIAEEKYGSCAGPLQEKEGPAAAKAMLEEIGYDEKLIDRVCYIVGHHHTYTNIDGIDYQILVEADFLVNLYEDGVSEAAVRNAYEKVFCTDTGKRICRTMFNMI